MDVRQIPRQLIEFNKSAFDSAVNTMFTLQDRAERYAFSFIDKATWFPEEGKNAINEWVKTYKQSFESLKTTTDENYKIMAGFFGVEQKDLAAKAKEIKEDIEEKMEEAEVVPKSHRRAHKA
jgi:hypothetical protein